MRSHPVAFEQCRGLLATLRGVRAIATSTTAEAAAEVAASGGRSEAAIAGERAVRLHGLHVVARDVGDHPEAYTRFVSVATHTRLDRVHADWRTALVRHRPCAGALHAAIEPFALHGIDLVQLVSRPIPQSPWTYRFDAVLAGHPLDDVTRAALTEVRGVCAPPARIRLIPRRRLESHPWRRSSFDPARVDGSGTSSSSRGSQDTPRFNLGVITIQPHREGPEPHEHADEDDSFYILEGELTFLLEGSDDVVAGPGTFVLVPPGVRHTFGEPQRRGRADAQHPRAGRVRPADGRRRVLELRRISELPPYAFAEIDGLKLQLRREGIDVIDLGFGNPDIPSPEVAVAKLAGGGGEAAQPPLLVEPRDPPNLRQAVCELYVRRFGVELDPRREAVDDDRREGGARAPPLGPRRARRRARSCRRRAYPIHLFAPVLAGASVSQVAMGPDEDVLDEPRRRRTSARSPRPRVLVVSFPHNPTTTRRGRSTSCSSSSTSRASARCVVVHDFAYADISFDGYEPPSILAGPRARARSRSSSTR